MNKGFTLIELIAVIALLGIVLLIAIPTVNDTLSASKSKLNDEQERLIELAARNWGVNNASKDNKGYVTIKELQTTGYLEDSKLKRIFDKSDLDLRSKVCIKKEYGQYVYTYKGMGSCDE